MARLDELIGQAVCFVELIYNDEGWKFQCVNGTLISVNQKDSLASILVSGATVKVRMNAVWTKYVEMALAMHQNCTRQFYFWKHEYDDNV